MGIIDVIIILLIGLGAVVGLKRGFFNQTVSFVGLIAVIVLSFMFKGIVSEWLFKILPFMSFGPFKDAQVLNILLYEFIGFFVCFSVLSVALRLILMVTNLFEIALKFTIILGIPSKILGAIIGALEAYVIIFVALIILNQPMFNLTMVHDAKVGQFIYNNTPLLSNIADRTITVTNDIYTLTKDYEKDKDLFNQQALDTMLRNNIIKKETAKYLVDNKKLTFNGASDIINKY